MSALVLVAAAYLGTGAAAIWGRTSGRRWLFWLTKPLPLVLLIVVAALDPRSHPWLLVALGCSALGDVLLMLPQRVFIAGLASFLAGLSAYIVHFSFAVGFRPHSLLYAVVPVTIAVAVVTRLWPHLGRLRGPVLVYVGVLIGLSWRMLSRIDEPSIGAASALFGAAGGVLFLVADSLLALRRFAARPIPYPLELGTYYLAQGCLVIAALTP